MRRMSRDRWIAIGMITPSILLIAVFIYGFIAQTLYTSMTDWGNPGKAAALSEHGEVNFVGLDNFATLFTGLIPRFRYDIVNTIFFTALFLIGCLGLGLLMAILLDQKVKGESIFRTIFLFPMALSFVVTGTVWRWMFAPNGGINTLPPLVGLPQWTFQWFIDRTRLLTFTWGNFLTAGVIILLIVLFLWAAPSTWFNGRRRLTIALMLAGFLFGGWFFLAGLNGIPTAVLNERQGLNTAILAIVLAAMWQMSGYTMAIYLAGLRGIPEELREAARVDGCNEIQVYQYVVLPLLQPITLSAAIILGHISLKIFDLVYVMAGGTNLQVDVPGVHMYMTSFQGNNFSLGSAIAIIMLIMVAVIIIPYLFNALRTEAHL